MIRVFTGGLNAVSGKEAKDKSAGPDKLTLPRAPQSPSKQDYVVVPPQDWLDGFATDDGKVRQFVAVPQGPGYSVEAQLTGQDLGGFRFEITPLKTGVSCTASAGLVSGLYYSTRRLHYPACFCLLEILTLPFIVHLTNSKSLDQASSGDTLDASSIEDNVSADSNSDRAFHRQSIRQNAHGQNTHDQYHEEGYHR